MQRVSVIKGDGLGQRWPTQIILRSTLEIHYHPVGHILNYISILPQNKKIWSKHLKQDYLLLKSNFWCIDNLK
jgi:hypothetical protein